MDTAMDTKTLRRHWLKQIVAASGMRSAEFARTHGIDETYLSQLLNGHGSFGEKSARNLERKIRLPEGQLDRPLPAEPGRVTLEPPRPGYAAAGFTDITDIPVLAEARAPYPGAHPGSIVVPVFDAAGSMGFGRALPEYDTVIDHMRLSQDWIRHNLPAITAVANLAVLSAYGDSMAPTFADGDILLVDRGIAEVKIDAVYVLALNDELFIKRVQRRITDGAIIIRSDNPLYEPVTIAAEDKDTLNVRGRVLWAWNGRKM